MCHDQHLGLVIKNLSARIITIKTLFWQIVKDTSLEALTLTRTLEINWEIILIFIYTRFNEKIRREVKIKKKAQHLAKFFIQSYEKWKLKWKPHFKHSAVIKAK